MNTTDTNELLTKESQDSTFRALEELERKAKEMHIKALRAKDINPAPQPTVVKKVPFTTAIKNACRKTILNIKYFFHGNPPTPFKRRMQRLAGIKHENIARVIVSDDKVIEFSELPSPIQVLKFRLCGFRYELLKTLDEKKLT